MRHRKKQNKKRFPRACWGQALEPSLLAPLEQHWSQKNDVATRSFPLKFVETVSFCCSASFPSPFKTTAQKQSDLDQYEEDASPGGWGRQPRSDFFANESWPVGGSSYSSMTGEPVPGGIGMSGNGNGGIGHGTGGGGDSGGSAAFVESAWAGTVSLG